MQNCHKHTSIDLSIKSFYNSVKCQQQHVKMSDQGKLSKFQNTAASLNVGNLTVIHVSTIGFTIVATMLG